MLRHVKQSDASVDAELRTLPAALRSITTGAIRPGARSACDLGARAHFLRHLASALDFGMLLSPEAVPVLS
jgi:hypothetical protein